MFDLKRFRKENGKITQVQMAEMFGCTQGNINAIESSGRDLTEGQMAILKSKFGSDVVDKYNTINIINNGGVNGRIFKIINENFNGDIASFCKKLNLSQAMVITVLERSKPSYDMLMSIIDDRDLNVNMKWLLKGEGEMFNSVKASKSYGAEERDEQQRTNQTTGVPYYSVDFIDGFDLVFNKTINPDFLIDFQKYNEADCWCNITGHSMEPEITHGDMIALKKIEDFSFLPLGEVYAIVTTNGMRTIKRLGPASTQDSYSLVPTNKSPKYGIQEIPKNMILHIFQVLGCMKRL